MKQNIKKRKIIIGILFILLIALIIIAIINGASYSKKNTKKDNKNKDSAPPITTKEQVLERFKILYSEEGYEFQYEKTEGDNIIFNKVKIGEHTYNEQYIFNTKTQQTAHIGTQTPKQAE